jgi:Na+/proline symporter/signal transduction histidine kinase
MLQGWFVIAVALAYIGLLFLIASYGDRASAANRRGRLRSLIYPLSLAIYCTSWTFFGSVGLASRTGYDFLTIYIGPAILVGLGSPLLLRIVRLAKAQNITSIADFIAARYGKHQGVAKAVALIAVVGSIPYIALQLKAVSASLETILGYSAQSEGAANPVLGDLSLFVAMAMATFAVLFGTRHADATEHQDGLMLAVASESMVKLIAFLAVGIFVTFVMFDGPAALFGEARRHADTVRAFSPQTDFGTLLTMTLLSFLAIVLLPRQFHVTVVENHSESEIRRAAWLFPLYLVLINLFVLPIAMAGILIFSQGGDSDMYVLALPLAAKAPVLTLVAFVGGLSAASAMVIVETVALAITVSNDLVLPFILQRRRGAASPAQLGGSLLTIRRVAIFAILVLAYLYYRSTGEAQLASIGLLSFAALAQLAPAFFGGLIWRGGNARGALAGLIIGFAVWLYTLFLPNFVDAGLLAPAWLTDGPFGWHLLRPQALLGTDLPALAHGVAWSLACNVIAYVAFSLSRAPTPIERVQAELFVPSQLAPAMPSLRLWRSSVSIGDLVETVARYLGDERTRSSFESFATARRINLDPKAEADIQLVRYAEHLLASAIGAASSRLVLSLLLRKRTVSTKAALKLLDDANTAIHYNREILQSALDHVRQGIAVFDKDMHLICWNRQFGEILDLPHHIVRIGVTLEEMLRHEAECGAFGPGDPGKLVAGRLVQYATSTEPFLERFPARRLIVEIRTNAMPGGGSVMTLTDITPSVIAAEELERANQNLERRVRERTKELEHLNAELIRAKAAADDANISKTRFLAAASHDILQPLNAARLYVTSLVEQPAREDTQLIGNIDASLEAVEDILSALLDMSRLDTGALRPEPSNFVIGDVLRQLEVEFAPAAREKHLELVVMPSSVAVHVDRRLARRLLQNFISNAVKYTPRGRVLVGCRRKGDALRVAVYDTGIGIPADKQTAIFGEFQRLEQGARVARGLGLGLSIVERIARVLDLKLNLRSTVGHGSVFSVDLPIAVGKPSVTIRDLIRPEPGQLDGLTVLCVDNEPKILEGMELLLRGWGCKVLTAADTEGALAALAASGVAPDGLLIDYHLNAMTGIEVIEALRRHCGYEVPAILITADRSDPVRDQARAAGALLLHKPVKLAALRALLGQWRLQRLAAAE